MELGYILSGGAPVMKRYQAGTTMATAGIPVLGCVDAATDIGMIEPMAASTAVNVGSQVGVSLDTSGTVAATGVTATSTLLVTVIINPDAVYRAKISATTTADTALTLGTTTAASSDGSVTTGVTTYDNGSVWGYTGANAGELRRADDTAGSLSIAMPTAIASGDQFLAVHGWPCSCELTNQENWDMTTDLTQLVGETAITDMDNFTCVDIEAKDATDEGRTNSFFHIICNNHLFGSSSLA